MWSCVLEKGIITASLHYVSFISILAKLCSPKFFSCLVSLNQLARIGLSHSLSSNQLVSSFLFGVGCIPPVNYEDASRPRLNCTINCTLRAWYATMSSVIGRPWPRYRFLETIFGTSQMLRFIYCFDYLLISQDVPTQLILSVYILW